MSARDEAKKAGLRTYPSPRACARGHRTERYVSSGNCVECLKITGMAGYDSAKRVAQVTAWKKANPHKRREYTLKQYGLTPERFDAMVSAQEGLCAICRKELKPGKATHVDHCHESGKVRGLLCGKCNTAIGLLDDSPERAEVLASYLRSFL